MRTYGQYCPIARASEVLAERWTIIILRNMLLGCETFNEISAGAPGLSRALLSKRLKDLAHVGLVEITPKADGHGSFYRPTPATRDLGGIFHAMVNWSEQWLEVTADHADPDVVLWSWSSTFLRTELLPAKRVCVRFEFKDQRGPLRRLWLLFEGGEAELCRSDPGFDENLVVWVETSRTFALWHLGLVGWADALRSGDIAVTGPRDLARSLPRWNGGPEAHTRGRQGGGNPMASHVGVAEEMSRSIEAQRAQTGAR
jgi:DNA-binding HxlR family transcriptional regulator